VRIEGQDRDGLERFAEASAQQGGRAKSALMKPLRSKAVEQRALSSPLRILAAADPRRCGC